MFLKTQSVYLQRNYCTEQADFDEMTFFYVKKQRVENNFKKSLNSLVD